MLFIHLLPPALAGEVFVFAGFQSYARAAMASTGTKIFLDSMKPLVLSYIKKLVTPLNEGIIGVMQQLPNIEVLELVPFRLVQRDWSRITRSIGLALLPARITTLNIDSHVSSFTVMLLYKLLSAAPATCGVVRVTAAMCQLHASYVQVPPPQSGQVYVSFEVTSAEQWKPMVLMQLLNCISDAGDKARCALITVHGPIGSSLRRWSLIMRIVEWKLRRISCAIVDVHFVTRAQWNPPRCWLRWMASRLRIRAVGVASFVFRVNDYIL
jgi:hypothetical protein